MFKRKWSGLPLDPVFPNDLKGLGYFINKDDEIRSIANEDNYFHYFIDRNERVCNRQRFCFNQAVQEEIHNRLERLGLKKVFLPFGATEPTQPKVPIFISPDAASKSRIVVIFGENHQDLGVLAHRVIGGRGGINKGSLVNTVTTILKQKSSATDATAPGIIVANMGELLWWPKGKRTLSWHAFDWTPMPSGAHEGNLVVPKIHHVPGNENADAHVKYIFEKVFPALVNHTARIDIIGIGSGADIVQEYLNSDWVWKRIGHRINCLAIVGGALARSDIKCHAFRQFVRDRTRAYVISTEPLGLVLSGPDGNHQTTAFTDHGCPVFSAGEYRYIETLFVACYPEVLRWLEEVALAPAPYKNPDFEVFYADPPKESQYWGEGEPEEEEKEVVKNDKDEENEEEKAAKQKENDRNKHVVRVDSLSDSEDDLQY
ncbi:Arb2 domain-containing protein [Poronia punctata]|nr:Arb2 domain-containing protein [Poronia punctata]